MSEWKKVKLGDVLNLRRGYDLPHSEMKEGNIPVAGSNGIIGTHNVATTIEPCITIGRSGSAGSTFIYDRAWAHNTTLYVDDFRGNDPKYLYYLLSSLPLNKMAGGSAVPSLNRNHIHPLNIVFPTSLDTQRRIASILSSLDDKIAVNQKICSNLEAQAQALFKHWFIDFAPFKDGKFVESELGLIPEGWRVGTFGKDVIEIKSGGTPKTDVAEYWENGTIPFFTPKDVSDTIYCFSTEKSITEAGLNKCNSQLYPQNTVFITARGTVGKVVLASCNMAMNQSNYALVGKAGYDQLYVLFQTRFLVERLKKKANGAVFSAITTTDFNERIVIPPFSAIADFVIVAKPLIDDIFNYGAESLRLSALRDTLLPKLMSGQIKL